MPKLAIHVANGGLLVAPFEAWVVAIINSVPEHVRQDIFRRVAPLEGASLLPDKYRIGEDALGTITMVEVPVLDLKGL